jgi:hypothetical protein
MPVISGQNAERTSIIVVVGDRLKPAGAGCVARLIALRLSIGWTHAAFSDATDSIRSIHSIYKYTGRQHGRRRARALLQKHHERQQQQQQLLLQ